MLELTHPNELKYEYREPGYWVIHNPFSSGIDEYLKKVESRKDFNSEKPDLHNNPFNVVVTQFWQETEYIGYTFLKDFYKHVVGASKRPSIKEGVMGWINKYEKHNVRCTGSAGIPHNDCCDMVEGIVANYWMSENIEESSTRFYDWDGEYVKEPGGDWNLFFDFACRTDHPMFPEFKKMQQLKCTKFPNLDEKTLKSFGYTYKGEAPAEPWKMTIYEFKNPHVAYIPESIEYRLSSCFLYGLVPHPWFRDL
jgi:hypothetical protein